MLLSRLHQQMNISYLFLRLYNKVWEESRGTGSQLFRNFPYFLPPGIPLPSSVVPQCLVLPFSLAKLLLNVANFVSIPLTALSFSASYELPILTPLLESPRLPTLQTAKRIWDTRTKIEWKVTGCILPWYSSENRYFSNLSAWTASKPCS